MQDNTKGILFGLCGMVIESLLPIISNTRPVELDPVFFSLWTMIIETIFIYPIFLRERMLVRSQQLNTTNIIQPIRKFSRYQLFGISILIGLIFSMSLVFQYWGFTIAGTIVGSIMLKSSLIFSMLLGFLYLHETITQRQLIYTCLLLFGLIICMTNGFQIGLNFNLGAVVLFFVPLFWMIGHSFTKLLLNNHIAPPMQILLNRISWGSIILCLFYCIFYPIANFALLLDAKNFLWLAMAGLDYALAHICWYSVLKYVPLSKSTVIYSFTPILSSLLALVLLNEIWNPIIIVGMFIVIGAIFLIMQEKERIP